MPKSAGRDGVVLGILNADGSVDVQRTRELVELAAPLKVTFHRAIDMTRNMEEALEGIIQAGCYRVLTSGGRNTVSEGMEQIKALVEQAKWACANYGRKWCKCRECQHVNRIRGGCYSLEREK